jgi:hypothetical protein
LALQPVRIKTAPINENPTSGVNLLCTGNVFFQLIKGIPLQLNTPIYSPHTINMRVGIGPYRPMAMALLSDYRTLFARMYVL